MPRRSGPQPPRRFLRLEPDRFPLVQQALFQQIPVLPPLQQLRRVAELEAHVLQGSDAACREKLGLAVIAVAGEGIDGLRRQESDLVIVSQHTDADPLLLSCNG